ncbi:AraC family transcription regulator [Klebsiella michiganensis]|nr:AraC family transcription regulator [Klebsiella michiganensis]
MRNIHFHHNALTAAEITTRRLCKLHRVTLFSPAICRVNRGSKVIVQGASEMLATPQQLIILPAEVELEVINQPGKRAVLLRPALSHAGTAGGF